jgi:hypothetical protein
VKLTPGYKRALEILRDHGPLSPAWFAHHYFPEDHPGWKRVGRCGPNGSTTGTGLILAAAGLLGKLRRDKLAGFTFLHDRVQTIITSEGRRALKGND